MQNCVGRLAGHTGAIRGLSQTSRALRSSAAERNRILRHLEKAVVGNHVDGETSVAGRLVDEIEEKTGRALRLYDSMKSGVSRYATDEIPVKTPVSYPPGCVIGPGALQARLKR
jgi:hypothetical protein